jgi:SAM-dependent MidA family methyltransferase
MRAIRRSEDRTSRDLAKQLAERIAAEGPITVHDFMAAANAEYYASRDPLGRDGDFITAPEISQMFGELIGLALADVWLRAGAPAKAAYVELGPGRGTLAVDALRAMRAAGLTPDIHLVETSPALRARQAERLPQAVWHDGLATLPVDRPLLVVANEFFDALPIRQSIGGRERRVSLAADGSFSPDPAPSSDISEESPASCAIAQELAARLAGQGGVAIIIDYGYAGPARGDTLQAVSRHQPVDPFLNPGEVDLTAHVDFTALGLSAANGGAIAAGPQPQGRWLHALGIETRAAKLAQAAPSRAAEVAAALMRLTGPTAMGELFQVMALAAPGWPMPEGLR